MAHLEVDRRRYFHKSTHIHTYNVYTNINSVCERIHIVIEIEVKSSGIVTMTYKSAATPLNCYQN